MNYCQKYLSCLLGIAALLGGASPAFAAGAPSLGMASSFAVLSALTTSPGVVTCTRSDITGDVGTASSNPLSVTQTNCTITGAVITPVSANVLKDFNDAYDALKAVSPCTETFSAASIGNHTFTPGVYCFDAAVTETNAVWTLDGGSTATWLFKIGNSAVGALTGTDFTVALINGASACNVTWWVDAAATMTRGAFNGNILAGAAITLGGTVHTAGTPPVETFAGRALAKAAVTLTDVAFLGCEGGSSGGKSKCNQGVGNGPENCDPGNSNQDGHGSNPFDGSLRTNDELGGVPGAPGRQGGNK
jgi:hypothetical protein